ncbi:MAG: carboxypeptidase-like regulatory domain-containing protein, partial [Planctomycetota bacterium]
MRARSVFTTVLAATISFAAAGATQCPSDVNDDGVVDVADFLQLLAEWGCTGCASDIDGSGVVDVADFLQLLADWGCEVTATGEPTLSGTVTNLWTTDPIAGATVTVGADVLVTDEFGAYAGAIAPGNYDVVFEAEYFTSQTVPIVLVEGVPMTLDAQLVPVAAVVVNVVVNDVGDPGGDVDVMADVVVLDGSTIQTYAWSQTGGTPAAISGADTDTATLTLGTQYEYKEQLFHVLSEPPITDEQLPPNVPPPPAPFPGGLQDRFEIAAPNPFALEEAGLVGVMVDVVTTSGAYSGEGDVHAHMPWKPATGVRNVPVNVPVLLHGKDQASYDWALTVPNPGTATLVDATTPYPEFTPDFPGLYEVTVTDIAAGSPVTLEIYAGNWRGVITGQDFDGRPVADSSCTGCHIALGFDKFTPWKDTGHAEIFTNNLNTSGYYNAGCFPCHSVGYDPDAANGGFDDASDHQDFLAAGLLGNPSPDNWGNMLKFYPYSALQANIQCENCHGPQWGLFGFTNDAHQQSDPRTSISSDVCATCHGEPLRHARFQQWQLSGHANYEVAIDEGDSGSCSRCHTGNGFLTWLPILLGNEPGDPTDDITVTWTPDEVHPQTCATCHDPHAIGTESGETNNATVRISDNTPMLIAGFQATDVGRGAICMTCHNSRRGLRNDSTFDDYYGTSEAARAPH